MKHINILVMIYCCGLILFTSKTSFADFYKYKDSNGTLRFTDNLAEVPESQRPNADRYKEYVPKEPETPTDLQNEIKETDAQIFQKTSELNKKSNEQKIQLLGKKIKTIQENLQKEYQQLLAKKKAIEELDQKTGPKNSKLIQKLNTQAAQLNKEIKAYNHKKETCIEAIKTYQNKIQMLSKKGILGK